MHVVITVISSITILEVQTKSTRCTPSPTTDTILQSDLGAYSHQSAPAHNDRQQNTTSIHYKIALNVPLFVYRLFPTSFGL